MRATAQATSTSDPAGEGRSSACRSPAGRTRGPAGTSSTCPIGSRQLPTASPITRRFGTRRTAVRSSCRPVERTRRRGVTGSGIRSWSTSAPLLQTFTPGGVQIRARHIADRTWSQLRLGPRGPVVHQEPSEEWMPAQDGATPLDRAAQARAGTPGRPLADGSTLVVLRVGTGEVRLARIVDDAVRASWRIVSGTPLGEVQLAERWGNRIVLVVKAYSESRDEFEVLVLDGNGLVRTFAVASDQWADAAPLAYFRLAGGSLYKLGTGPAGAFVARYDLESAG